MSCVLPEIGSDSAKSCFWWFYFFLPGFWGIELGFWKLTGLRRWNVPTKLWRQPVLDTIRQNQGLPSQDLMVFQKVGKVSWYSVYSNEAAKLQGLMILTCVCIPKCTICWVLGQGSGTGLEVCAEACPASTPLQAHLARAPGTAGSA